MKSITIVMLYFTAFLSLFSCESSDSNSEVTELENTSQPIIIAHRGAQSIYPEHTLEGYKKAIELGADFIEPDLVLTKDGYLVVRHEPILSGTTNVSELPEFDSLKTTKELDGKMVTDWFVLDFTLNQIKQLKARQAYSGRSTEYDDLFEIPTFEEVLQLVKEQSEEIGIYPEIKHPYFHNALLDIKIEDALLASLDSADLNSSNDAVYVQCFEVSPLQYINELSTVKLVQLISCYEINDDGSLVFEVPDGEFISYVAPYDFYMEGDQRTYEYFTTEEGMEFVSTYADGIGPWKPFIISYSTDDSGNIELLPTSDFVEIAHENSLLVHPYTFRNENTQWSGGDPETEYHLFFDAGIDGLFTDYTDEAVSALNSWNN